MRRPYRKHYVLIDKTYIPVKNWYRNNPEYFQDFNDVPTSEQIGTVLINLGYNRGETNTEVIYTK